MGVEIAAAKVLKNLWQVGVVGVMFAFATLAGCEKRAATIPSVPALPSSDTPEGQLARVMQRLDSALETAQAASGSGVISERRAYRKFFPAEGDNSLPKAVVFIETKRAIAPMALNAAAEAKLRAEAEKQEEELPENAQMPLVVAENEQIEVDQYPLIYDGQRWKLAKELDPPNADEPLSTEKILFDYALGVN